LRSLIDQLPQALVVDPLRHERSISTRGGIRMRAAIRSPGRAGSLPPGSELPAEVDLDPGDLVVLVEREDLGVRAAAALRPAQLIGDDHLVSQLDEPHEVEALTPAGAGPAALEVAVAVELWIRGGGEGEVGGEVPLEHLAVASGERLVAVASDLPAVHPSAGADAVFDVRDARRLDRAHLLEREPRTADV